MCVCVCVCVFVSVCCVQSEKFSERFFYMFFETKKQMHTDKTNVIVRAAHQSHGFTEIFKSETAVKQKFYKIMQLLIYHGIKADECLCKIVENIHGHYQYSLDIENSSTYFFFLGIVALFLLFVYCVSIFVLLFYVLSIFCVLLKKKTKMFFFLFVFWKMVIHTQRQFKQ